MSLPSTSHGLEGEVQGGSRVGEYGRDHIFFHQSSGGLGLPSPQTHPSPSHTFILPYKLTHSSSHPLQGQPNGPSEMHMIVQGFDGNTPCGRFLPAHSPPR